ncbi:MAG: hypothetical protein AAF938_11985 [Myxococcota bacterium]
MRFFVALALLAACTSSSTDPRLVVSVRTDYTPFREFDAVALRFGSGDAAQEDERIVRETDNYVRGQQVADPRLAPGLWRVTGELVRGGRTLATRAVTLEVSDRDATVTILFTRSCENVSCPNDNPALDACLGGRCVDSRCTPETPEFCPADAQCETEADCSTEGAPCVVTACEDAVCLERASALSCGVGEVCDYVAGCVAEDADAGVRDMAVDTMPVDLAMDTAMDLAMDSVVDMADGAPPLPLACAVASGPEDIAFFDFEDNITDAVSGMDGQHNGTRLGAGSPCGGASLEAPAMLNYFVVPDRRAFDIDEGSIDFWAFLPTTNAKSRAIYSRDAVFADTSGHLALYVLENGRVFARLQNALDDEAVACSDAIELNAWHRIGMNFGPGGFQLWIDGERQRADGALNATGFTVRCGENSNAGLAGNRNPITLGLSQAFTREGTLELNDGGAPPLVGYPGLRIDNLRLANVRRAYGAEVYP